MKTLKDFAHEMSRAFVGDKRNDGTEFRKLRDGSPEWMKDVCFKAHGDMGPDDHRYEMIEEVCDALADHEDEDEARDSLEADIYTSELTGWLHSRVDRTGYVDEALEECGEDLKDISKAIALGQMKEKEEVFGLVVKALTELVDAQEEEEEDTDNEDESEDEEDEDTTNT